MRSPPKKNKGGSFSKSRTNMSASNTRADQSSVGGENPSTTAANQSKTWWGNVDYNGGKPTAFKPTHLSSSANTKVTAEDNIKQFNTKHGERDTNLRQSMNPTMKKLNIHTYDNNKNKEGIYDKKKMHNAMEENIRKVITDFQKKGWIAPC